jgi:hypothetical protein
VRKWDRIAKFVGFYAPPALKRDLWRIARAKDLSLSQTVRALLRLGIERDVELADAEMIAPLRALLEEILAPTALLVKLRVRPSPGRLERRRSWLGVKLALPMADSLMLPSTRGCERLRQDVPYLSASRVPFAVEKTFRRIAWVRGRADRTGCGSDERAPNRPDAARFSGVEGRCYARYIRRAPLRCNLEDRIEPCNDVKFRDHYRAGRNRCEVGAGVGVATISTSRKFERL